MTAVGAEQNAGEQDHFIIDGDKVNIFLKEKHIRIPVQSCKAVLLNVGFEDMLLVADGV